MKNVLFLIVIFAFTSRITTFAQCNIETYLKKDGFTIVHKGEFIEDDAVYGSNGKRLTNGLRLTLLGTIMKSKDGLPFYFVLNIASKSTYPNEADIIPRMIQFWFTDDTHLTIRADKYSKNDKMNSYTAEFILSNEKDIGALLGDIKKMIIIDDNKEREVKLKSSKAFSRQISCILDEVNNLGNGNTSNVVSNE